MAYASSTGCYGRSVAQILVEGQPRCCTAQPPRHRDSCGRVDGVHTYRAAPTASTIDAPPRRVTMAEMTPAPGCNGTTMRTITPGSGKEITKGSTATVHATGVKKGSEVLEHEGPGPGALHVPGRRRRRHQGLGPGLPRHEGRRGPGVDYSGARGLRRVRLPGLGHPAGRHAELHASMPPGSWQVRTTHAPRHRPSCSGRARTTLFSHVFRSTRRTKRAARRPRPARRRASRSRALRNASLGLERVVPCASASMMAARRR